mmetsp:Transcript_32572/g.71901  ORF Transcript_32572/g.71901 Transcript_32572/m.71901 type:complete len:559 (+) Transcript_32572:67-1743(+)
MNLTHLGPVPRDEDDPELDTDSVKDATGLFRRISWRVLPLFFCMVVFCYIDRTNLAFAAIQLTEDLEFTPEVFGLGSGLFFLGYAGLQIPSNLILKHTRANVWLACIAAAWAFTCAGFAAMRKKWHFYALRLLLGATEAGAFPGMWYYFTKFYPGDRLTMPYAVVESGISLSHVVAAPLAAGLLSLNGARGMRGWQWLFLLEACPSLLTAIFMLLFLPASVETAKFLTEREKRWLTARIAQGQQQQQVAAGMSSSASLPMLLKSASASSSTSSNVHGSGGGLSSSHGPGPSTWELVAAAASNPYAWYLGAVKFVRDIAGFGIIFWTPTIVQAILKGNAISLDLDAAHHHHAVGVHGQGPYHGGNSTSSPVAGEARVASHDETGVHAVLLTAIPFALAAGFSFIVAHHSQREGEKLLHISVPYVVAGIVYSFFPWAVAHSALLGFTCLTVGVMGVYSGSAANLALLQELSAGPSFVVAAPLYNSLGNIGGFVGPYMVGALVQQFRSFALPSVIMAGCLIVAGLMVFAMPMLLKLPGGVSGWTPGSGLGYGAFSKRAAMP